MSRLSPLEERSSSRSQTFSSSASLSIHVGIDFGTTYSGVAYAVSSAADDITIVKGWPTAGKLSRTKEESKVPSQLYYYEQENSIGWGYDVPENCTTIQWFKLLLLTDEDLAKYMKKDSAQVTAARTLLRSAGKSAEDAVADYLKKLWDHTLSEMEGDYLKSGMMLPFKVVLTVPAIWPPYAIEKMHKAARTAGILAKRRGIADTVIMFVTEPEAAAMATFWTFKRRLTINAGDIYIVCDIGGGTTDIISYRVSKKPPFALEECALGAGALCGSIFVDQAFENLLRHKFGSLKWQKISAASKARLMNDDWEHGIKRNFIDNDGDHEREWSLQIPSETVSTINVGAKKRQLGNGLKVLQGEIKGVFNVTLDETRDLIRNQIKEIQKKEKKLPKAIVLVGGFGKCEYVYNTLKTAHEGQGIEILRPKGALSDAWTAICRGAALKAENHGLNTFVRTKISRYSYGLKVTSRYDQTRHKILKNQKYFDDVEEMDKVDIMQWFVERGDALNTLTSLKKKYHRTFRSLKDVRGSGSQTILRSDNPIPPLDTLDPSVERDCIVTCNTTWQREDLETRTAPSGNTYLNYNFEIGMDVEDAQVQFYVCRGNERVGEQKLSLQFDEQFQSVSDSTPSISNDATVGKGIIVPVMRGSFGGDLLQGFS